MSQSYQCVSCKHFVPDFTCKAFPEGIPEEIYSGEFDHAKPYKKDDVDDNGTQWEKAPGWEEV
jgi:hypothetical protein